MFDELAPPIADAAADAAQAHLKAGLGSPTRGGPVAPGGTAAPTFDALRSAIRQGVAAFPASLDRPGRVPPPAVANAFWRLGAAEARAGRGAADLHVALSIAAQVTVQQVTERAVRSGLTATPDEAGHLARCSLAYVDRLQRATAAGYASVRTPAGAGDHIKQELIDVLLNPEHRTAELGRAAAAAGWTPPRTLTVAAVGHGAAPLDFLPPDVLLARHLDVPCLFFPDPNGPGRRALLDQILGDRTAVVGPTVVTARAALSQRLARSALERLPDTFLADYRPVHLTEHIPAMLLVNSPDLIRHLTEARLAPLQRLRPAQRPRVAGTLLAYFECGFNAAGAAERLHAHPQTVRHRLREINRLFGPDLYNPAYALDYLMALRAWHLLADHSF
ncbi:helix-turn-helix domain-containing protein [Actinomadura barringtoniae]|uniref:Helix-turn-helix domain-containing protein n=1 Tax=Actinomadura barringtoniae TaxID=1427535 RepID=A0A939T886_9ACTN|nr:PucR family transcriptional regulator [Actinomadura barringtoniae]MBO2453878.1 helix-turn-helix domain-containing protein [Actinomadura barringtoniae]